MRGEDVLSDIGVGAEALIEVVHDEIETELRLWLLYSILMEEAAKLQSRNVQKKFNWMKLQIETSDGIATGDNGGRWAGSTRWSNSDF